MKLTGRQRTQQAPYLRIGCDLSSLGEACMREFFYWLTGTVNLRIVRWRFSKIHVRGFGWPREVNEAEEAG